MNGRDFATGLLVGALGGLAWGGLFGLWGLGAWLLGAALIGLWAATR
jgi:hypothetical protein